MVRQRNPLRPLQQTVPTVYCNSRYDFSSNRTGRCPGIECEQATGLAHAQEDRVPVEGGDSTQINQFAAYVMLLEIFNGMNGFHDHVRHRDNCEITSFAQDARLANRQTVVALGHWTNGLV